MGLQNQLTDISSESFPILLVILLVNCVAHLRSLLCSVFAAIGFPFPQSNQLSSYRIDSAVYEAVGSGFAGLFVLAEQLKLNRNLSYRFVGGRDDGTNSDCVVCLNWFGDGDHVRRLDCSHLFHKQCFDGWLDQLNFSCPLCRSALVAHTRNRVASDLCAWFSLW